MNVIFAAAPEAVAAVRNATTSIPIVAVDLESEPVAKGYVNSLARPGANMTGFSLDIPEMSGKQVGLHRQMRSSAAHDRRTRRNIAASRR
jgi:putative tryptophan/tyrosine transport system substrate-binding protein